MEIKISFIVNVRVTIEENQNCQKLKIVMRNAEVKTIFKEAVEGKDSVITHLEISQKYNKSLQKV